MKVVKFKDIVDFIKEIDSTCVYIFPISHQSEKAVINGIATFDSAKENELTFSVNKPLCDTNSNFVIVSHNFPDGNDKYVIKVRHPKYVIAKLIDEL